MIAIALRRGAKSKIGKARFGKCHLTITPPREKNYQKKNGGRGPTGPPISALNQPIAKRLPRGFAINTIAMLLEQANGSTMVMFFFRVGG
jgi:hypothetical protein